MGKEVLERRTSLEMNLRGLTRADVTPAALRCLEQDRHWQQDMYHAKIKLTLGWMTVSLEAIRNGEELADDEPSQSTIPITDSLIVGNVHAIFAEMPSKVPWQISLPSLDAVEQQQDYQALTRATAGISPAPARAAGPNALTSLRLSMRESGAVTGGVRRAARDPFPDLVARFDPTRRALVALNVFNLLDEQEPEVGDTDSYGDSERNEVSDLPARCDLNSEKLGGGQRTDETNEEKLANLAGSGGTWVGYVEARHQTADEEI